MINQNKIEKNKLIKKVYRIKELHYNFDCMGSPAPCIESINCLVNFIELFPEEVYNNISVHNIIPTTYGTIRYEFEIVDLQYELEFGKNTIMWIITDSDDNVVAEIDKVRKFSDKKEIPENFLKEL